MVKSAEYCGMGDQDRVRIANRQQKIGHPESPITNHRLAALLFDLGDTLMIEESEEKDAEGTTLRADLLPGAADMLRLFRQRGYRLALVADSRPLTPPNVLGQHGVYELFDHLSISEVVGVGKPNPLIFERALDALGIPRSQYGSVVMVGNHLERDVAGANRLGLISIFFHWNERRRTVSQTADETPDYTVHSIQEMVELIERLESAACSKKVGN
jgi:FMN phosphatase YigB (HAD superfamily)